MHQLIPFCIKIDFCSKADRALTTTSEVAQIEEEQAAKWPCYIGDHHVCVGASADGECPCPCGHVAAQAIQDLERYGEMLIANQVDAMIVIEKRYGLYGYPPSIVGQAIAAVSRGEDMDQTLDTFHDAFRCLF